MPSVRILSITVLPCRCWRAVSMRPACRIDEQRSVPAETACAKCGEQLARAHRGPARRRFRLRHFKALQHCFTMQRLAFERSRPRRAGMTRTASGTPCRDVRIKKRRCFDLAQSSRCRGSGTLQQPARGPDPSANTIAPRVGRLPDSHLPKSMIVQVASPCCSEIVSDASTGSLREGGDGQGAVFARHVIPDCRRLRADRRRRLDVEAIGRRRHAGRGRRVRASGRRCRDRVPSSACDTWSAAMRWPARSSEREAAVTSIGSLLAVRSAGANTGCRRHTASLSLRAGPGAAPAAAHDRGRPLSIRRGPGERRAQTRMRA